MDKAGNLNLFTEIICIHRKKKRKTKKKIELGTIFAGATYFLPLGSLPIQISNSHSHIIACSKEKCLNQYYTQLQFSTLEAWLWIVTNSGYSVSGLQIGSFY